MHPIVLIKMNTFVNSFYMSISKQESLQWFHVGRKGFPLHRKWESPVCCMVGVWAIFVRPPIPAFEFPHHALSSSLGWQVRLQGYRNPPHNCHGRKTRVRCPSHGRSLLWSKCRVHQSAQKYILFNECANNLLFLFNSLNKFDHFRTHRVGFCAYCCISFFGKNKSF